VSTITDALKKRQKEVGEEEVQEIVPVSLDAPDVTIPKEKRARRIAGLGGVLLIAAGVVIGAVMLYNELRGGKATEEAAAQVASSPRPERENPPPSVAPEEALPLPQPKPDLAVKPAGIGSEVPKSSAAGVSPSAPLEEPPAKADIGPEADLVIAQGPTAPAEAPIEAPPDPFAEITLQGISRFDPTSPEALINGKSLKVGDSINGIVVVEIGEESVKLRFGSIERVISYE
jgi:hypothetical protein